jgi:hypothetical protein
MISTSKTLVRYFSAIPGICAPDRRFSSPERYHNQTDPLHVDPERSRVPFPATREGKAKRPPGRDAGRPSLRLPAPGPVPSLLARWSDSMVNWWLTTAPFCLGDHRLGNAPRAGRVFGGLLAASSVPGFSGEPAKHCGRLLFVGAGFDADRQQDEGVLACSNPNLILAVA